MNRENILGLIFFCLILACAFCLSINCTGDGDDDDDSGDGVDDDDATGDDDDVDTDDDDNDDDDTGGAAIPLPAEGAIEHGWLWGRRDLDPLEPYTEYEGVLVAYLEGQWEEMAVPGADALGKFWWYGAGDVTASGTAYLFARSTDVDPWLKLSIYEDGWTTALQDQDVPEIGAFFASFDDDGSGLVGASVRWAQDGQDIFYIYKNREVNDEHHLSRLSVSRFYAEGYGLVTTTDCIGDWNPRGASVYELSDSVWAQVNLPGSVDRGAIWLACPTDTGFWLEAADDCSLENARFWVLDSGFWTENPSRYPAGFRFRQNRCLSDGTAFALVAPEATEHWIADRVFWFDGDQWSFVPGSMAPGEGWKSLDVAADGSLWLVPKEDDSVVRLDASGQTAFVLDQVEDVDTISIYGIAVW